MKYESIKNNRDFLRAYKKGKRAISHVVVLYRVKNQGKNKRIGITVSKKVGNAVTRNKVKRLIRQSIYENYDFLNDGFDYVFVARVRAANEDFNSILKNISYVVKKIRR